MKNFSSTTRVNSHRASRNSRTKLVFTIVFIGIALFFLLPTALGNTASIFVRPVLQVQEWFLSSDALVPSLLRDRSYLLGKIATLEQEKTAATEQETVLAYLQNENQHIKSLFNEAGADKIIASVIARPNEVPYDTLVIDKGARDDVALHAPVYVGQVVVGYIIKVFEHSSVAELVTSPGVESTAYVVGPNIYTKAVGQGGGVLRVGVPQGVPIAEGNVVILPVLSGGVFGKVVEVEADETQPEQYGFVTLSETLSSMYLVGVGSAPVQPLSFEEVQEAVNAVDKSQFFTTIPDGVLLDQVEQATSTASSTEEESGERSGEDEAT